MKSDSKHFCILPWVHMHIWPNGTTYPCCLATNDYVVGNTNESSFKEIWNSPRMKELRLNILEDKPTSGCTRCYEHEENGSHSMRMNMNNDYQNHMHRPIELTNSDGSVDDVYMAYMDIRFSNICNFKCRTCGPELSSFWVDDAIKLNRYTKEQPRILRIKDTLDELWEDMEQWIDTVERIYFAGGEPLIMDEHYKILEYLIEIGKTDIVISYNTNFSKLKFKNKNVLELWKHFKNINIGASLDDSGVRAEYMRSGTKWKEIEANRIALQKEVPHAQFQVSSTISIFNAWHCIDFFDEWISKGYVEPDKIDINILLFPENQRLQNLPYEFRQEIIIKIKDYIKRHKLDETSHVGFGGDRSIAGLNALIHALNEPKSFNIEPFRKYNNAIDKVRNENLFDAFPELEVLKK